MSGEQIFIFDTICLDGVVVKNLSYTNRQELLNIFMSTCANKFKHYKIFNKKQAICLNLTKHLPCDGILYVTKDGGYYNTNIYKHVHEPTIDLLYSNSKLYARNGQKRYIEEISKYNTQSTNRFHKINSNTNRQNLSPRHLNSSLVH